VPSVQGKPADVGGRAPGPCMHDLAGRPAPRRRERIDEIKDNPMRATDPGSRVFSANSVRCLGSVMECAGLSEPAAVELRAADAVEAIELPPLAFADGEVEEADSEEDAFEFGSEPADSSSWESSDEETHAPIDRAELPSWIAKRQGEDSRYWAADWVTFLSLTYWWQRGRGSRCQARRPRLRSSDAGAHPACRRAQRYATHGSTMREALRSACRKHWRERAHRCCRHRLFRCRPASRRAGVPVSSALAHNVHPRVGTSWADAA
jgi:hypothetical protein